MSITDTPDTNALPEKLSVLLAQGSLSDILKVVAPEVATLDIPATVPLPAVISTRARQALDRLPEVFGQCVPTERRTLEPVEVTALVEEKITLDELKKMAESRMESIRTTVFNHLDIEVGDDEEVPRDVRGHYVRAGEVRGAPGTEKRFTREVRGGSDRKSVV